MTEADLPKAEFFVEASDFERLILWQQHAREATALATSPKGFRTVDWQQDSAGFSAIVGWYGDLPVNVCFSGARLNGRLVVFHEAVSRVTDSFMVDKWIKKRSNPRWDNGRPAFTNAMNFHMCLEHVTR